MDEQLANTIAILRSENQLLRQMLVGIREICVRASQKQISYIYLVHLIDDSLASVDECYVGTDVLEETANQTIDRAKKS